MKNIVTKETSVSLIHVIKIALFLTVLSATVIASIASAGGGDLGVMPPDLVLPSEDFQFTCAVQIAEQTTDSNSYTCYSGFKTNWVINKSDFILDHGSPFVSFDFKSAKWDVDHVWSGCPNQPNSISQNTLYLNVAKIFNKSKVNLNVDATVKISDANGTGGSNSSQIVDFNTGKIDVNVRYFREENRSHSSLIVSMTVTCSKTK